MGPETFMSRHQHHTPFVQCLHINKRNGSGSHVFREAELQVHKGELVCITGPSGSGKTTLIKLLFGLESPDTGYISIGGRNPSRLKGKDIPIFRRQVGVIFQDLKLVMRKTVLDNVALPLAVSGKDRTLAEKKVRQVLRTLRLDSKSSTQCGSLSGHEQQLVAIARATVNDPLVLLADEPTAYLDETDSRQALALMSGLSMMGTTVIIATGDLGLPRGIPHGRTFTILNGKIAENPSFDAVTLCR